MSDSHSDAFVFFGATGDLAYKKIFPALQAMAKRGHLDVPIIGVAKAGWTLDQLRARARDSVERHGGLDPAAFPKLYGLLRYVDGDYRDAATFQAIREQLGAAKAPGVLSRDPANALSAGRRSAAPIGLHERRSRDRRKALRSRPRSAQALNRTLFDCFDESTIFRIDHYLGKRPVHHMLFFRFANAFMEPFWTEIASRACRITMAEDFGVQGRGAFYDETGTVRDVVQNHLLQVLCNLAMEPPVRTTANPFAMRR
jgi:glucose-6-phosphate 1-dehydrogenase